MRIKLLSKRYAKALFELAEEMKLIDKVDKDLRLVKSVFDENRQLKAVFSNPVIDAQKKINILKDLFKSHIQELTMKFLQLITKKEESNIFLLYVKHILIFSWNIKTYFLFS